MSNPEREHIPNPLAFLLNLPWRKEETGTDMSTRGNSYEDDTVTDELIGLITKHHYLLW